MKIYLMTVSKHKTFRAKKLPKCKQKLIKYSQFIYGAYVYSNIYESGGDDFAVFYADVLRCFDTGILRLSALKYHTSLVCCVYSCVGKTVYAVCDYQGEKKSFPLGLLSSLIADFTDRGFSAEKIILTYSEHRAY